MSEQSEDDRKMQRFNGLMTSMTPHWATPKWLYEELNKEFSFDFDPCPLRAGFDGFSLVWGKSNFINPPYGRAITTWIYRAYVESCGGKTCVLLLPARTDTRWWHDIILKYATEIRFIRGRLKFGESKNSAPFPSCIVVFRGKDAES